MSFLLTPVDGSPASHNALSLAARLAAALGTGVRLVHVLEPAPIPIADSALALVPQIERRESAIEILRRAEAEVRHLGVPVECRLEAGDPAKRILHQSADSDVEMIVLAHHGHGALARVVMGNVSGAIVRESQKPVVVTR